MRKDVGRANVLYVHVTLLPALAATGELKTKPTQHSVKELRGIGIQPDVIVLRSDHEVPDEIREKIALFTDVDVDAVIPAATAETIYEVPLLFEESGLGRLVVRELGLGDPDAARTSTAGGRSSSGSSAPKPALEIALVGKYIELPDAYLSVTEALKHAAWAHEVDVEDPLGRLGDAHPTENLHDQLEGAAGIVVPGGFGHRGIEGKVLAAHFARDHKVPYLGLCLGLQCAVIEFAREVIGTEDANSTEFDMFTEQPGHRLHARPARAGGQGRHDAARALPGQAHRRLEGGRGLRPGGHLRAAPPPLRGQQPLSPDPRGRRDAAQRASRPTAGSSRSSSSRTTRGSWPASSTPSSRAGPSGRTRCSTAS